MMTIRPLAAVALLAGSLPLVASAGPAAAQASRPEPSGDGLYSPFPATPEAEGIAAAFFASYGDLVPVQELRVGSFPRPQAVAAAPPRSELGASERAGVGVTAGAAKVGLLAALAALILAAALALGGLFGAAPARAAVPQDFKGVVAEDIYVGNDAYQAKQFKALRKVGFTMVRQVFRWPEIEPVRGSFDFSATDRFVLAAAKAGVRVQPLLFGEPAWATSRPAGDQRRATFPPTDPADFGVFAAAIAKRYGAGGSFWLANPSVKPKPFKGYQLWNEPNLPLYWGLKPDAKAYAAMVAAASAPIKAVDRKALVITGGIPDSKLGIRARPYLSAFLKAGGGKSIDAVGIHPYSVSVAKVMSLARGMRRTLNGVGGKKIGLVVTEIGWAVGGPRTPGRTVTASGQAKLVPAVYKAFARSRSSLKLRSVVYFAWRDSPTYTGRSDFWGLRTGLFTLAGKPKPVVKTLTRSLKALK